MTTYYVATAAGNGDDAHDGSFANPWATVEHAVDWIRDNGAPGDFIRIREGSYLEQIDISGLHGTVDNWITICPYNDEHVLISSNQLSDHTIHYDNYHGWLYIQGGNSYIHISGIEFGWAGNDYGILVIGHPEAYAEYIKFDYCTIHHASGSGIHCHGGAGAYPDSFTRNIEFCYNTVYMVNDGITHSDDATSSNEAVSFSNVWYPDIHHNTIYNYGKEGIDVKSGTKSGSVYNNNIYANRVSPSFNWDYDHVCIYVDGYSIVDRKLNIYNNYISGVGGTGIRFGAEDAGGGAYDINIYNNVITIYKNSEHSDVNGIMTPTDVTNSFVSGANVYSNTVYLEGSCTMLINCALGYVSGIKIMNNIFYNTGYYGLRVNGLNASQSSGRVELFNNLFFSTYGTNNRSLWNGDEQNKDNYPERFGKGAIFTNPKFISSGNLHLQSTSPAISSARMLLIADPDYDGHPRGIQGDIGAYEYAWEEEEETPFNSNFFIGQGNVGFVNPNVRYVSIYRS